MEDLIRHAEALRNAISDTRHRQARSPSAGNAHLEHALVCATKTLTHLKDAATVDQRGVDDLLRRIETGTTTVDDADIVRRLLK